MERASETISRIDLPILPRTLLSGGTPISVGPQLHPSGAQATNLESPLVMSLSLPPPHTFLSANPAHSVSTFHPELSHSSPVPLPPPPSLAWTVCSSLQSAPLAGSLLTKAGRIQVMACCPSARSPRVALLSLIVKGLAGPKKASLSLAPMAPLFSPPYSFLHPSPLLSDLARLLALPLTCPARSSLRVVHPGRVLCLDQPAARAITDLTRSPHLGVCSHVPCLGPTLA